MKIIDSHTYIIPNIFHYYINVTNTFFRYKFASYFPFPQIFLHNFFSIINFITNLISTCYTYIKKISHTKA